MSKKTDWEGKSKGGVLGHKIFIFFLKNVGVSFSYFILYFVAFYFLLFAKKANRASAFYFREIWNYSPFKSIMATYRSYYKFGQTLLDKVAVLAGYSDRYTFHFDGEEHLWGLAKAGNGAILISAHVGNWEIAGHFLKKLNTPINVVMVDAEHRAIKQLMDKSMYKKKFNTIVVKDDFSHLMDLHRAVREKEIICIHGDRFIRNVKGKTYRTKFMGKYAVFPKGPFELASRMKVPYSFVFAIKETNTHYHFFATPGKVATGNTEQIIDEYVSKVEEILKEYPEQWFNYFDFWEQPEAEPEKKVATIKVEN